MLTLADFDNISTPIDNLYREFANAVLRDIARRLLKMNGMTSSAAWQISRLMESGKTQRVIIRELAKITGQQEALLKEIFTRYGLKSLRYDNELLVKAGKLPRGTNNFSPAMLRLLQAEIEKTSKLLHNLILTTAGPAEAEFIKAADLAYMLVSHGTMSWKQAVKTALAGFSDRSFRLVHYPSGKYDHLDVAIRRAVLTGVSQTAGRLQLMNIDEVGVELVAVSAHIGARNKGGLPENHEMWQGRVYRLNDNPELIKAGYQDFFKWTGFGTGPGLCGWNCRHSFYPYFKGISPEPYTKEILDDYASKKVTYNGKEMSFYEGTQKQRSLERKIRDLKRKAESNGALGLDNTKELREVRKAQATLRDFVSQTGLHRQPEREGPRVKTVRVSPPAPQPIPPAPVPQPVPQPVPTPQPASGGLGSTPAAPTLVQRTTILFDSSVPPAISSYPQKVSYFSSCVTKVFNFLEKELGNLTPNIPFEVTFVNNPNRSANAWMTQNYYKGIIHINLDKSITETSIMTDLLHEFGHIVDFTTLSEELSPGGTYYRWGSHTSSLQAKAFRKAARDSKAIGLLEAGKRNASYDQSYIDWFKYTLSPEEMFARAFAQHMGNLFPGVEGERIRAKHQNDGSLLIGYQWEPTDFLEVERMLAEILKRYK